MTVRVPLLPWWLRWLVVAGLAGFIFSVSIVTVPPETIVDERPALIPLDKWRHFVAYAVLGYALAYASADWDRDGPTLALLVVGLVIVYGVGIEVGQSVTPGRYFSVADAYANALGGILVVPWYLVRPRLEFVSPRSFLAGVAENV